MREENGPSVVRTRSRIPYALSTMGTTSPEDLIAVEPRGSRWFQLYVWRDRARAEALIDRVEAAGFRTLVLTVDVPSWETGVAMPATVSRSRLPSGSARS